VYVVGLTPAPDLLSGKKAARTGTLFGGANDNEQEFTKRESIRTALERVCKKQRQNWHVVVMPDYALEVPGGAVRIPVAPARSRA
jgi:hypothetical protein